MECYSGDGQGRLCIMIGETLGAKRTRHTNRHLLMMTYVETFVLPAFALPHYPTSPPSRAHQSLTGQHPVSVYGFWVWFSLKLIDAALNH
jgi:hypothetical protein